MKIENPHTPYLRAQRGQSLLEIVLILPVILLLCFGIFDFGRAVYFKCVITNAAREGARYGTTDPSSNANIVTAVQRHLYGINSNDLTVTIVDTGPTTNNIQIRVSYNFVPVTPMIASLMTGNGGRLTIASQSIMRIER